MIKIRPFLILAAVCLFIFQATAQTKITSPKDEWGHNIGDDYFLANYTQLETYLKKIDAQSDRLKVVDIGKSAEGRTMYLSIITSAENHKNLDRYKDISKRLALAENLSEDEARKLAKEGRAVVWIDGGLHANEVLGAQQVLETVYQLVDRNDEETQRFLNDTIVLVCLVNPDGMELVSNWYMRNPEPTKRSTSFIPRLYQKYIGHDNNRDFYLSSQAESTVVNRIFYHEWFPQIIYNHHQTGPTGTVMFAPPFRDPFNYNFDSLISPSIDLVGAAMHTRFVAENKPGVTMRSGAPYSTWWNGGLRTTVYFHNMIGLLTETIGNPTPMDLPLVLSKQIPKADMPMPIAPQKWHFRQSMEYSITANRAVIDVASRYRETLLLNLYKMGKNSIERGSRDNWTIRPSLVESAQAILISDNKAKEGAGRSAAGESQPVLTGYERGQPAKYYDAMRTPENRDARGYIIPVNQPDFLTAVKFVNALIKTGVTIHQAKSSFTVNGKEYGAGSFIVKAAQAFRPHVIDMFEPQDHPNDFQYPGGPPVRPYDNAGYTLAYQMGIKFDRILDGFDGPFEKLTGFAAPPKGTITHLTPGKVLLYALLPNTNDAFIVVNRLLASNENVERIKQPVEVHGKQYPAGTFFILVKPSTKSIVEKATNELGLNFDSISDTSWARSSPGVRLRKLRIALWDKFGGSMPSGWTRWILEQYEFPFTVVYPQDLNAPDFSSKYDVVILVSGAVPARDSRGTDPMAAMFGGGEPKSEDIPKELHHTLGNVTVAETVPQLKKFIERGGIAITIGSSTTLGYHLGLPIANALTEKTSTGNDRVLSGDKYYIPGSVLQIKCDNTHPLAYGMPNKLDIFFDNSPVFRLKPDASLNGIRPVAWFDSDKPLRSGWAWGQNYLRDGVTIIDANVGKGKLFLFGPEILFRAQPHGTFKFLFNGIYF